MKRLRQFHSNAVWPPLWLMVSFAAVYMLLDGAIWLIERSVPNAHGEFSTMPELVICRSIILSGAAVAYAVWRLARFHPICNSQYAEWLKLTPWTAAKPLPLGPVHLVWQDAVVVGAIAAVAKWHGHVHPQIPAIAFGFVYLAVMTLLLALTRQTTTCVILGFLWPALVLPFPNDFARHILLGAIVAVTGFGYWRSLRAFPWKGPYLNLQTLNANINIPIGVTKNVKTLTVVGWPFAPLSPKPEFSAVSTSASLTVSALLGWWAFCIITGAQLPASPELLLFAAILAALLRFAIYRTGVAAPFNLWGRFATGRFVVPGFDRVVLAPLATVLLAIAGGMLIRRSGAWHPLVEAGAIAVVSFVLLGGDPTLRRWHLTGQLRFAMPRTNSVVNRFAKPL